MFDQEPTAQPLDQERQRQELELRLRAPLRANVNGRPAAQANELDTPLFAAASSPSLF